MQNRARIKLSVYFILLSSFIPSYCRSARTNKVLAMARESMTRVERSLDVRQIIQTQDDLHLLLNCLMSKQQLWLFRRQKSRLLSSKTGDSQHRYRNEDTLSKKKLIELLEYDFEGEIDKKLLWHLFSTEK
jgi:hypothetical protein